MLDTMATAASDEAAVGGIAARLKARKPVVVRPAAIESASSSDADDDDDEEFDTAPKRLPKTRCSNHASTVVQVAPVGSKRLDGSEAAERRLRAAHADDESRLAAIALDAGPLAGGHGLRRDGA